MKKGAPGCLGYVGDDVLHTYESLWNNQDSMESIREFFRGLENCVVFFFGLVWVLIFHLLLIFWSIEFFNGLLLDFFPPSWQANFHRGSLLLRIPFWKKRWCFSSRPGNPPHFMPEKSEVQELIVLHSGNEKHRNERFGPFDWRCISYSKWGYSIAMLVYQRVTSLYDTCESCTYKHATPDVFWSFPTWKLSRGSFATQRKLINKNHQPGDSSRDLFGMVSSRDPFGRGENVTSNDRGWSLGTAWITWNMFFLSTEVATNDSPRKNMFQVIQSAWPFYPLVGGHQQPFQKGHVNSPSPKRSRIESPGKDVLKLLVKSLESSNKHCKQPMDLKFPVVFCLIYVTRTIF